MFDLEKSIAGWRQQMLAAGIKAPVPLEELENHLREEIERQLRAGESEPIAFAAAVRQIGGSAALKPEFAKVGEPIHERLRRLFCALAGIPDYQLATNMNTSNSNLERGWVTYLKSAALVFPAFVVWVVSCVVAVPRLKEICVVSGTAFPKPILTALDVTDFIRNNLILGMGVILAALILLEWRSSRWPRYRRLVFGITAFSLNFVTLAMIAGLLVFAVIAGANLLHAK
jgi:hypothetical protein